MEVQKKATPFATFRSAVAGLSFANWSLLLVLGSLLVFAIVVSYYCWTSAAGTDVPESGYLAMALGIIFALVVGVGLMGLLFYSSRYAMMSHPSLSEMTQARTIPLRFQRASGSWLLQSGEMSDDRN
jgi:hypothetical protein